METVGTKRATLARASGLCGMCVHARDVTTSRGASFLLCDRSTFDPRFARYPPLPVRECSGYQPDGEGRQSNDRP
jgi:hypothetical protein